MNIAICDDEPAVLAAIQNMLEEEVLPGKCSIAAFSDSEALLEHVASTRTEIAFIDIMIGDDVQGVNTAKQVNTLSPDTAVVFISGFTDHAEEFYQAEHTYFLQKPLTPDKLRAAIEKASRKISGETVSIIRKGTVQSIRQDSIVMAESFKRYIIIYTLNEEPSKYKMKMDDFEKLLNPAVFLRCHQSYIVNVKHVVTMESKKIMLSGDLEAPVSRRFAVHAKRMFLRKLGGTE